MSDSDSTTETPAPDLTGRTLGDFHVLRKIGEGGMGQVYLARQQSLKRDVALKILSHELSADPTALKRFQAEAEAVARVSHTNIVQVYAIGVEGGLRYMVLEYVEGRNLRDYIARKGPPDLPVALTIMRQVAAALQRASEIGIVHRDIKPENILVTRKAEVKVADFGLSRYFAGEAQPLSLTRSGVTLGTPLYMSPEQVQGQPVDHRSDIYSFGVTCYHLLAGHPPFHGATAFDVAVQHVQKTPPPLEAIRPDLPADLCVIVHKMLAKKPEDRYQSAREIIRDLARVQKNLAGGSPSGSVAPVSISSPALPVTSSQTVASGSGIVLPSPSGSTHVPSGPTVYVTVPVPPSAAGLRWSLRVTGVVILAGLAIVGWWVYGLMNPHKEARGTTTTSGLPDSRTPEPIVSTRERELRIKLESRSSKPSELFDAALELGVLYVRERRMDEADKVFRDLEQERFDRPGLVIKGPIGPAAIAGRLGQAIVLSFRDKAKESNELVDKVAIRSPTSRAALENFLFSRPEFGQLLAEALNRNAENLNLPKLPDRIEWLRTPSGLVKGPKN